MAVIGEFFFFSFKLINHIPYFIQESVDTNNALGIKWTTLVIWTCKHEVHAKSICTVFTHPIFRVYHVSSTFTHLLAVRTKNHALIKKPLEGLIKGDEFLIVQ